MSMLSGCSETVPGSENCILSLRNVISFRIPRYSRNTQTIRSAIMATYSRMTHKIKGSSASMGGISPPPACCSTTTASVPESMGSSPNRKRRIAARPFRSNRKKGFNQANCDTAMSRSPDNSTKAACCGDRNERSPETGSCRYSACLP